MSQLFTEQAKHRAVELGVADRVKFIHGDAAGHVSTEKVDVAACIGATWIGGGVAGTIELLARNLRSGGIILVGEPFWRQLPPTEEVAKGCDAHAIADFLMLPELLASFGRLGYDVVEMVWPTRTAGTDTRRPSGSPCATGSKPIPTTSWPRRFAPN